MMKSKIVPVAAGIATATALLFRYQFRVPLTEDIRGPLLVASLPSLWIWGCAVLVGAVGGIVVGRYLERRDALDVMKPLLLPALVVAAYIPGVLFVFPFLSAFAGHFLDVVLVGCLVASLWKAVVRFEISLGLTATRLAVVAFVIFLLLGARLQENVGLSGDEPHYLLITYSLLNDGDLAVENNYTAGDYRHFFNGKIGPHLAHGSSYSIHGVGLPLLLLPGFALLGLWGVLLTEAVMGAFLIREVFLTAERMTGSRTGSLLAAVGFGFTTPALFLSISAYPELPAALVVVAGFRRMISSHHPSARQAFLWGLIFGLLPFLHMKYLPLAAVLVVGSLGFWRKNRGWALAGWMLGALSLLFFFAGLFGNPNPMASYGRQRIFLGGIPLGLAGLLFDQEFGLLPVSPFYVVAIAAIGTLLRREIRPALLTLGVLAAVALPGAAHPLWTGGTSPPARFLFPALPLLAVAAAVFTSFEPRRGLAMWVRPLLIASLCLAAFMALGPGQPLYLNQRDGTGRLFEAMGNSWDVTHYLPSLVRADMRSVVMAVAGVFILLGGLVLHRNRRRILFPSVVSLVFLYVFLVDWTFPGQVASESGTRWMTGLLRELPQRENDRFLLLPSVKSLSHTEVRELVDIPLNMVKNSETGDWRSPPFHLPAGVYRLEGGSPEHLRLCNGQGCLSTVGTKHEFATRVALAHFHVRGESPRAQLRLRAKRVSPSPVVADRSLRLDSGVDVHALDDHAYLDPKGFWVRAGAKAQFALEAVNGSSGRVALANGGQENWVVIEYHGRANQFLLQPWDKRTLELPLKEGVLLLSVTSTSGFRPSELDSSSSDRRMLGVLLTSGRL